MTTIKQPDVSVNIIPASLEVENTAQRVLIVGQKIAAGTAPSGALVTQIQNDNSDDELLGATSQLAGMVRAFKKLNQLTRVDAIPLDAALTGVAATASITVATGAATQDGVLTVIVGSAEDYSVDVAIATGDDQDTVAAAIETAINTLTNLPVTPSTTTNVVTLTADNAGPDGNGIPVRIEGAVAGIDITLAGFTGGAIAPTTTSVFDAIVEQRYQTVVWPAGFSLDDLTDELDARFNVNNDVLDGVGITTVVDTFANHLSALGLLNSQSLAYLVFKDEDLDNHKGSSLVEFPEVISAQVAAIRSLRLTEDANIAQFTISTNGARDSFGGTALASFPYFNTPMPELTLIPVGLGWTTIEVEGLVDAGGGTIGNNRAGNEVILGEIPTTYKNDAAGNPDDSFKYVNYVDTASGIREYFVNNLRSRFAQSRLTEGDLVPRRSIANRPVIESFLDKLYVDLSTADFVLTQAGEEALQFFRANREVILDVSEGKVTINMQVPIVTQLRTIVATLQLAFSTNG